MEYAPVLREMMRTGQLNQAELAKRLRVTQPTISRWLKGKRPELDQHQRIIAEARRLGILQDAPAASEVDRPGPPLVRVAGYVGAGAEAHFYNVAQGDLDEVPAPPNSSEETIAVEIRGDSLGSIFDRWLAYYDDVRRPVTADLIGRLCVVGLESGQIVVKRLRRGHQIGTFRLESDNAQPLDDVAVEWAARVKHMAPRA